MDLKFLDDTNNSNNDNELEKIKKENILLKQQLADAGRSERQQGNSCNYSDTGRVCKLERLAQGKRQNEKGVQKRQLCYEPVHF